MKATKNMHAPLQKEYEKEEGIHFGIIEMHSFANIPVKQPDGDYAYLGIQPSEMIFQLFEAKGYIDEKGKVQDKLRAALKTQPAGAAAGSGELPASDHRTL